MLRTLCCAAAFLLAAPALAADASKWTAKAATSEPPQEVAAPVRALLGDKAVQVVDGDGKLVCEIWFRKELPVKASPEEIEKGITYRKVEQSTLLGAVRFAQPWVDFRKQNVKPGVYTFRMGWQPEDGNHQGTAPYGEFCLLLPVADDKTPDPLPVKKLRDLSTKSISDGDHPVVMLLVPNAKADDTPKLVGVKSHNLWMLSWKEPIAAGDKKGSLGIGLTVFGVTTAE
jgi:hypothetical protein